MRRISVVQGEGLITAEVLENATRVFPPSAIIDAISLTRTDGVFELRVEGSWD